MPADQRADRRVRIVALATGAAIALTGCVTGERPSLVDEPEVDDAVAAAVLDRLDRADTATFAATYDVVPTATGATTPASVVQSGFRMRVKIGEVDYFSDGTSSRTCSLAGDECAETIEEGRISNLNITHLFWGDSARAKLEVDTARSVAPSIGHTETIAGQAATCADVQVPSIEGVGSVTYCALDAGVLARYVGADVTIELTSYSPTPDEAQLTA